MTRLGWLLDASVNYDKHCLTLWIKSDGVTRGYLHDFQPALYVTTPLLEWMAARDNPIPQMILEHPLITSCSIVPRLVSVYDDHPTNVLEVRMAADSMWSVARDLERLPAAVVFHADIDPVQQFFITEDLFPFGRIEFTDHNGVIGSITSRDTREAIEYETPHLETVRIDVVSKSTHLVPGPSDPIDRIVVHHNGRPLTVQERDESATLLAFQHLIDTIDPDVIVTWGGDDGLLGYLVERADVHGLTLVLSRDGSPLRVSHTEPSSFWQYNQVVYRPGDQVMLAGRIHIDEASSIYYSPRGIEGIIEGCRLSCVQPQRVARMSIGMVNAAIQYYTAFKMGLLIPPIKRNPEFLKSLNDLATIDRGGLIFQPRPDVYEHVAECDFVSMFPTLMVTRNIGPETICIRETCPYDHQYCVDVPGVGFRLCNRRSGIVANSLSLILEKRAAYKQLIASGRNVERYSRIQNTLKMILVSCFGYLGFRNARFGRVEAHAAVTAFAREILLRTREIAESLGLHLIHGIVDSVWLRSETPIDIDKIEEFCRLVTNAVGIDISPKGIYHWFVIPSSRTVGSIAPLNRYYGLYQNGSIKIRGLETRRHDTCAYVQDCQMSMIRRLARGRNRTEFLDLIPEAYTVCMEYVDRLYHQDVDLRDLVITAKISRVPTEYRTSSRASIAALQLINTGYRVYPGQRVRYIITDEAAETPSKRVRALQLLDTSDCYDPDAYARLCFASFENLFPTQYLKNSGISTSRTLPPRIETAK